jgi:putative two-component system response regulator
MNSRRKILIIDDNPDIHADFRKVFGRTRSEIDEIEQLEADLLGVERPLSVPRVLDVIVESAYQGEQGIEMAMQAAERRDPYYLAFVDVRMPPGIDGIETIKRIWQEVPDLQCIVCSAFSDYNWDEITAVLGRSSNLLILQKPFEAIEVLQCAQSLAEKVDLEQSAIFALAKLAESRDSETGAHLHRMRNYSRIIAQQLSTQKQFQAVVDSDYVRMIYMTSLLHDIGKVGIPDSVLLKPGRLSDHEFEIMKQHTVVGAETLDAVLREHPGVKFLCMARDIALTHHERFDGSGYPAGLVGEEIPLCGRIVALADVYDSLTTRRVYKNAFTHELARSMILEESGRHFDPAIVEAFSRLEPKFRAIGARFSQVEQDHSSQGFRDASGTAMARNLERTSQTRSALLQTGKAMITASKC